MQETDALDYYELLQISPNADPDMVHRVYRLLAQRFHPDNAETGDAARFRQVHEAYTILERSGKARPVQRRVPGMQTGSPETVFSAARIGSDFEYEQAVRLTVLEALYTNRRNDSREPGVFDRDIESMIGRPREQLEFTFWYLMQRNLVKRGEQSRLIITADGVDYLEEHYDSRDKKRLGQRIEPV